MAANIINLPTSAAQAVQNPRQRGRYPKTVVPAWKVNLQRQERACRMTEAQVAEMELARVKKDAEYQRGFERGREDARMERLAMDALKSLATVMLYLTTPEQEYDE